MVKFIGFIQRSIFTKIYDLNLYFVLQMGSICDVENFNIEYHILGIPKKLINYITPANRYCILNYITIQY